MEQMIVKNIVEAALFAAGRPMSMNELLRLFHEDERPERSQMRDVMKELTEEYTSRGIELVEVASGYRVQVRHDMGEWLGRLSERRPPRYSRALMETLALVAYRQPITRGDIEDVRGVSVSSNIVRTLLERGWVRIVGHRDVPGRPAMFGTTKEFLDYFNLKSLDELPSLAELKDMDRLNAELDFGEPPYDDLDDESESLLGDELTNEPGSDEDLEPQSTRGESTSVDGEDSTSGQDADVDEFTEKAIEDDEFEDDEFEDDELEDDLPNETSTENGAVQDRAEDGDMDDEDYDEEEDGRERRSVRNQLGESDDAEEDKNSSSERKTRSA